MYSMSGWGSVSQVVGQRMFLGTTPVHCTRYSAVQQTDRVYPSSPKKFTISF